MRHFCFAFWPAARAIPIRRSMLRCAVCLSPARLCGGHTRRVALGSHLLRAVAGRGGALALGLGALQGHNDAHTLHAHAQHTGSDAWHSHKPHELRRRQSALLLAFFFAMVTTMRVAVLVGAGAAATR